MAYAPKYKHDVFISYRRKDDLPITYGEGPKIKWVSEFKSSLNNWLNKELEDSDADIWMDVENMPGNEPIPKTLDEHVKSAATLVVVLSKSYIESSFCMNELNSFTHSHPPDGRIFVVCLGKVEPRDKPDHIKELTGYLFYDNNGRPFHPEDKAYNESLEQIKKEIYGKLKELRLKGQDVRSPERRNQPFSAENAAVVYLAKGNSDVEDDLSSIRTYLEKMGYTVVPSDDAPSGQLSFSEQPDANLARAKLFVQYLGKWRYPGQDNLEELQYQMAKTAGLETMQGCSHDTYAVIKAETITNEAYRNFLKTSEVKAMDLEDFKMLITNKLDQLKQKQTSPVFGENLKPVLIYTKESDEGTAKEIREALEAEGFLVAVYYFEEGKKLMDVVRDDQLDPAGLVLVYGATAEPTRIRDGIGTINKIRVETKADKLMCALYFDPPSNKDKPIPTTIPQYFLQFDKDHMERFKESIRAIKARA